MTTTDPSQHFPTHRYESPGDYWDGYAAQLAKALASIDRGQLDRAAALLLDAIRRDATIFSCGNGGSAAIANHLQCDHQKGIHTDTGYRPRVVSLSSNVELITAVGNDIGYEDIFSFPLRLHGRPGDVLFVISSSGNSENIVRALGAAAELKIASIALTGFSGGRSKVAADVAVHVDAANYGIVEDCHQACMHALAQFIRHAAIPEELLTKSRF